MQNDVNERGSFSPRPGAEAGIRRRWKLFIVLSSGIFLGQAAVITFLLPEFPPVAWALLLLASCHVAFLLTQGAGRKPTLLPKAEPTDVARQDELPTPP
jgi:hypothetical protein